MKKPFNNYSKDMQEYKFKKIANAIEYYFKLAYVDLVPIKVAIIKTIQKYRLSSRTFFRYKIIYNSYLKIIK